MLLNVLVLLDGDHTMDDKMDDDSLQIFLFLVEAYMVTTKAFKLNLHAICGSYYKK